MDHIEDQTRSGLNKLWLAGYKPMVYDPDGEDILIAKKRVNQPETEVYLSIMQEGFHKSFDHRMQAIRLLKEKGWTIAKGKGGDSELEG